MKKLTKGSRRKELTGINLASLHKKIQALEKAQINDYNKLWLMINDLKKRMKK